jgi:hypothetical protein
MSLVGMWSPPILTVLFVEYFETIYCLTIFYVCRFRHFVPAIQHSLRVELLSYVQPRFLLPNIQGICCHSCHSHLPTLAGINQVDLSTWSTPFKILKF